MSCSPSPRQTKSTSGTWRLTCSALSVAKTPPKASLTSGAAARSCARQDLGVRVARRGEEAHADQVRLPPQDLRHDDVVRRVGVGLIEEQDLVAGALQDRGERHDADGRESHDLEAAVLSADVARDRVELRVADVDEHDPSGPRTHGLGAFGGAKRGVQHCSQG